jgi:hypothetical protein
MWPGSWTKWGTSVFSSWGFTLTCSAVATYFHEKNDNPQRLVPFDIQKVPKTKKVTK